MPVTNLDASIAFWENMGFVLTGRDEESLASAWLTSDFLNLGLYVNPRMRIPGLTFREPDMAERIEYVRAQGHRLTQGTPISRERHTGATLLAPEGTPIYLLPEITDQET